MCGIAAVISNQNPFRLSDLGMMMKSASHRGPDGFGFLHEVNHADSINLFVDSNELEQILKSEITSHTLLGHARLSIIDLDIRSGQPMRSGDGRYGLVFNGEIYNFLELKEQLEGHGFVFSTEGDAEVLLNALIHWGSKALQRLRGMFALVFVDFAARKMLVARDRFGIKPLYRWESSDGFVAFASEIKQFTCLSSWESITDFESVGTYISNGITDYSSRTFFEGVSQILPGNALMIDLDTRFEEFIQWYSLPAPIQKSLEHNQPRMAEFLSDAVSLHLQSDVEVASCLSGGIDSTVIVVEVARDLEQIDRTHVFRTFTAGSDDKDIDESARAARTASHLGLLNECTMPSAEGFRNDIESLMWHQEQPFGSASVFAQYRVFRLIQAHGIKVALDGQGADELFGGYDDYLSAYVIDLWKKKRPIKSFRAFVTFKNMGRIGFFSVIYMYLRLLIPSRAVSFLSMNLNRENRLFLKYLRLSNTKAEVDALPVFDSFESIVRQIRRHQFFVGLPMLLRFEDRNSMASSVEARVPFLDHVFVDYIFKVDENDFFRHGNTKTPLRNLIHGLVPDEVVQQKRKIGFASEEWSFLLANVSLVVNEINDQKAYLESCTSVDFVMLCLESLTDNKQNKFVWRLYCLALWRRVYKVESIRFHPL